MYQYAAAVRAAPTTSAHGSHTNRQRRVRRPIAASSATAAMTCTVIGIHPCINDR